MDAVLLSKSRSVCEALENMLTAALGSHGYVGGYVDVSIALMVVEIAKRAEDKPEWFPRGKWATIQSIKAACEHELDSLWTTAEKS